SRSGTLFLDLGSLAGAVPQVVELGPTDVAPGHGLDAGDDRRVDGKRPLHTDAEADLADGEGLPGAAPLAADDRTLEDLDSLAISLDDAHVHLQGVARPEVGDVVA